MAWTTPRSWVTGELVSASIMNAHVRDNLDFLYGNKPLFVGAPGTSNSVVWPSANAAILVPFQMHGYGAVASTDIYIDTSAGNIDVGVFTTAGARVVSNGGAASPGTGQRTITFASTNLAPGPYYWAMSASDTALQIRTTGATSVDPLVRACRQVATSYPLPSSLTVGSTRPVIAPSHVMEVA